VILIDPSEGSAPLLDYVLSFPGHPPVQHEPLKYGDVAFTGNGPNGFMLIGLEVKSVSDCVACIESQRLTGHQLPGMKATYDATYLVVCGEWRAHQDTGMLQIKIDKGNGPFWWTYKTGNRTWSHYEFMAWLTMVELGWGIRTRMYACMKDVARGIIEMYRVTQKDWEDHKTINPFYLGPTHNTPFTKPSLVEWTAAGVDGIGPAKAREIGKRFHTVSGMVESKLVHWKGIDGVGKQTAVKIIHALWGIKENKDTCQHK